MNEKLQNLNELEEKYHANAGKLALAAASLVRMVDDGSGIGDGELDLLVGVSSVAQDARALMQEMWGAIESLRIVIERQGCESSAA